MLALPLRAASRLRYAMGGSDEPSMWKIDDITELQDDAVRMWHDDNRVDNSHEGLYGAICEEHACNYRLWHEEDTARCPSAGDTEIADCKRRIDRLNQQRNDCIEHVDELLLEAFTQEGVAPVSDAYLPTEMPGSVIDRLSVMSLRIYHLQRLADNADRDSASRVEARRRLVICRRQRADLAAALQHLFGELAAGRAKMGVYRQFKLYNDPRFNPRMASRS